MALSLEFSYVAGIRFQDHTLAAQREVNEQIRNPICSLANDQTVQCSTMPWGGRNTHLVEVFLISHSFKSRHEPLYEIKLKQIINNALHLSNYIFTQSLVTTFRN